MCVCVCVCSLSARKKMISGVTYYNGLDLPTSRIFWCRRICCLASTQPNRIMFNLICLATSRYGSATSMCCNPTITEIHEIHKLGSSTWTYSFLTHVLWNRVRSLYSTYFLLHRIGVMRVRVIFLRKLDTRTNTMKKWVTGTLARIRCAQSWNRTCTLTLPSTVEVSRRKNLLGVCRLANRSIPL